MPLIDDSDIQVHLPIDKLMIEEIPDHLDDVKTDVERIIRGNFAAVLSSTVLAGWTTPAATPKLIRAIGGRLAAALIYRLRTSEEVAEDPEYAQFKYNEAMDMMRRIIAGTLVLEEVTTEGTTQFDNTFYFPNNDTTDEPKFTMGSVF